MKTFLFAILLLVSFSAFASIEDFNIKSEPMFPVSKNAEVPNRTSDAWTIADTQRQVIYSVLAAGDARLTQDIKNHPGLWESNKLLGSHPSNAKINIGTLLVVCIDTAIAYNLSADDRKLINRHSFQAFSIGIEFGYNVRNINAGLGYHF